ncbi:hypothetical protein FRC07_011059 [Ceratobasidium sp. 392]|nr:hypothetical protein FRC07_011059 [Ceratobasidium sp. 392]
MNPVGIFWDYENCAPPAGTPGYVVAERLRATCGVHGSITQFRAYLELSAPHTPPAISSPTTNASPNPDPSSHLSTSPKTLALRSELQSSGVSLIDCPHDSRKNVADAMLACDLVCFALDHPAVPLTPHPSLIPSSPFSIPSTPFSYIPTSPLAPSRTTVVLVSGDRDFAYPLAVLKARKYEVGLIVPPGGAHPALRAQASWVLNWKDVMEDPGVNAGPKSGLFSGTGTRTVMRSTGQASSPGVPAGASNQPVEPRVSPRRSSFASRRGSVSNSLRGSSSSPSPVPSLPPPPPPAASSALRGATSTLHIATSSSPQLLPPPPPPPEDPAPQLPLTPRMSRRPSIRRAAKTGSRPPSRSRSRVGMRGPKSDNRVEEGVAGPSKVEQKRPQPTIIPVALTASPVGSVGPSLAAMSPQGHGRPHTPPLFSTHPVSPPPVAAPPALAPPPTPPTKASTPPVKAPTPPAKPPTPPRDAARMHHRPPVPHVSTPRPPVPTPQEPAASSKSDGTSSQGRLDSTDVPAAITLQSLVPVAPALLPNKSRPPLTVPSLTLSAANASTLTPATPVTPPASPPFRTWARLQPVNDETDADGDQAMVTAKRAKKGKGKSTDDLEATNREKGDVQPPNNSEQVTEASLNARKEPTKLAVDVTIASRVRDQPSAISGVDSILRSYCERTPCPEYDDKPSHLGQAYEVAAASDSQPQVQAPTPEAEDEDEEKFNESYFTSLAQSPPTQCASWTPPTAYVPRTPGTVKAIPLESILGESTSNTGDSLQAPSSNTPRPVTLRAHTAPTIQTLLAGFEDIQKEVKREAQIELLEAVSRDGMKEQLRIPLEQVYSRTCTPRPTATHRHTIPTNMSTLGLFSNPSADPIYREFQALIDVLERLRGGGNERPLRSLVGNEFPRGFFASAGISSFKDYVNRASMAGVVDVGNESVQGREWISLNRHWQGINSGFQ